MLFRDLWWPGTLAAGPSRHWQNHKFVSCFFFFFPLHRQNKSICFAYLSLWRQWFSDLWSVKTVLHPHYNSRPVKRCLELKKKQKKNNSCKHLKSKLTHFCKNKITILWLLSLVHYSTLAFPGSGKANVSIEVIKYSTIFLTQLLLLLRLYQAWAN